MKRTDDDYYIESKRIRNEVLLMAEALKAHPLRFTITNGITMDVEITKSDLKTVLSKNVRNNKFNAIKNALAKDIRSYLEKADYLGWRPVAEGKHIESAYFAYYSRELGCKPFLCMRKLEDGNIFKPYAIIDEHTFNAGISGLRK
jgi:hypothetical protein